ncbi:MAG: hypothetical protein HOE90_07560 [Bacteriovoracaceae bacterium]|nr:hypothetical protein [Bacteriovoracaceae bacterium]
MFLDYEIHDLKPRLGRDLRFGEFIYGELDYKQIFTSSFGLSYLRLDDYFYIQNSLDIPENEWMKCIYN